MGSPFQKYPILLGCSLLFLVILGLTACDSSGNKKKDDPVAATVNAIHTQMAIPTSTPTITEEPTYTPTPTMIGVVPGEPDDTDSPDLGAHTEPYLGVTLEASRGVPTEAPHITPTPIPTAG